MKLRSRPEPAGWMLCESLKILVILSCFAILTACGTTKIEPIPDGPCPLYPELITLTQEMIEATPKHVQSVVVQNYILLDEYAQKLEVRAGCGTQ